MNAKEAEKEAKLKAKEAEKEAKLNAKEAEKEAKLNAKESKKEEKKVSKKEVIVEEEVEEEPDIVKRIEVNGVKYLKSKKTGIIYNMEEDVIGKWNESTMQIEFLKATGEEEEEDYEN